jgi:hypothetical protein
VADDGFQAFHAGEAAIFEATADAMAAQLPPGFDGMKLFLSEIPEAAQQSVARQTILDALNAGQLFVAYAGHGATTLWADEVILHSSDLASLTNVEQQPFVTVLNCLNGNFGAPLGDSLGEAMFMKADGGAVAFFAPTSVSPIAGQAVMGEAIARALFREGHVRIGDALLHARTAMLGLVFFEDLSNSWVLLGDPATRLAFTPVPIAEAGEDVEVSVKTPGKTKVRLAGEASGGLPGPFTFSWRVVAAPPGSAARLKKESTPTPVLILDVAGEYILELIVRVNGLEGQPDTVTVRAIP